MSPKGGYDGGNLGEVATKVGGGGGGGYGFEHMGMGACGYIVFR
jgi:hypothetical protein